MVLEMNRLIISCVATVVTCASALAQRTPTVTYTATGIAGSWDLEFSLTNNFLPGEGDFYFLGVSLETGRNIVATPSGWDSDRYREWSNQSYGGSSIRYNNVWLNLYSRPDDILPSYTKSGFVAHCSSLDAPSSVPFFAFAAAGVYNGYSNYSNYWNPGFEGTATLTTNAVPEPAGFAVLGLGVIGLLRRRLGLPGQELA